MVALAVTWTVVSAAAGQPLAVPAKVLERTEPVFPLQARAAGIEGDVRFRADITSTGTVERVEILSVPQADVGFEAAVTTAVSRWRFSPGLLRGAPVPSEYRGTLSFSLRLPGQAIFAASSKDAWTAVLDLFRQFKIPVETRDNVNQLVKSGRVRYLALPLPDLASISRPPGFRPERLTIHVFVTPGIEPARVSIGSVTELEPIASNDTRNYKSYDPDPVARWFFEELSRRLGARMEMLAASAERRAEQARTLMPVGLTDACATAPAKLVPRSAKTSGSGVVTAPERLYRVEPDYPRELAEARTGGLVIFHGEITEHGTLINPEMTSPANAPPAFVAAAQLAFAQWRFFPPKENGCPARVEGVFTVQFTVK
jgi:TonB family protein